MIQFSIHLYVATGISTSTYLDKLYSMIRYFALCITYDVVVIPIT